MKKLKAIWALLLFVCGTWLLWWNEGISAAVSGAIGSARPITVELRNLEKADPSFSGKMVHATGLADTKDTLTDPLTSASATAIRLERKVQFYQITEHKSSRTTGTGENKKETITYTYEEKWVARPINSSYFYYKEYDKNVILMDIPNETFFAPHVTFGAYLLSPPITSAMSGSVPIDVTVVSEDVEKLAMQITPPSVLAAGRSYVHVRGSVVHLGRNPSSPAIGDIRITYTAVLPSEVSILGQVAGNTIEPFKASNGSTFSRVYMGNAGMNEMYGEAETQNTTNMWLRRVMGTLLACFGVKMVTAAKLRARVAFPVGLAWSLLVIAAAMLSTN